MIRINQLKLSIHHKPEDLTRKAAKLLRIRPEDIRIIDPKEAPVTGVVESVIFKGVHYEILVEQAGTEWKIHSTQAQQPGEIIGMNIGPDEIHIMHKMEDEE